MVIVSTTGLSLGIRTSVHNIFPVRLVSRPVFGKVIRLSSVPGTGEW